MDCTTTTKRNGTCKLYPLCSCKLKYLWLFGCFCSKNAALSAKRYKFNLFYRNNGWKLDFELFATLIIVFITPTSPIMPRFSSFDESSLPLRTLFNLSISLWWTNALCYILWTFLIYFVLNIETNYKLLWWFETMA